MRCVGSRPIRGKIEGALLVDYLRDAAFAAFARWRHWPIPLPAATTTIVFICEFRIEQGGAKGRGGEAGNRL